MTLMTPRPLLPLYLRNYKIYGHALWDISRTPRAIYCRIKFCRISIRNVDMMAWNRKYILGNQRKFVCSIVNLTITSNKHFYRLLSHFHGHLAWICCWHDFLMSIFIAICDPENMCLVFGNLQMSCSCHSEAITTSGFERDHDAILVIWRRHVPHVVSPFTEFMDT